MVDWTYFCIVNIYINIKITCTRITHKQWTLRSMGQCYWCAFITNTGMWSHMTIFTSFSASMAKLWRSSSSKKPKSGKHSSNSLIRLQLRSPWLTWITMLYSKMVARWIFFLQNLSTLNSKTQTLEESTTKTSRTSSRNFKKTVSKAYELVGARCRSIPHLQSTHAPLIIRQTLTKIGVWAITTKIPSASLSYPIPGPTRIQSNLTIHST